VLEPAPATANPSEVGPMPSIRLAEPFERLRDASDKILAASGARPRVFLANLGTPSDFNARATFAKNFFEAGGIETVTNDGFTDTTELIAAFRASGTRLACLCSSNEVYAKDAVQAAVEVSKAGATHIYLAGRPGDLEAALKDAGVQTYINAGGDMLATLNAAHELFRLSA
jgi:methylmalonyl-CoA mutase